MVYYGASHSYGARVDTAWCYRGLRTAFIENELLRAVILLDKGADVISLVHKPTDTEFLWRSPTGVRAPHGFVSGTGAGDQLWLDRYEGGWQSVFPNGGWPSAYRGADLGLHAESTLLPWDVAVADEGPERAALTCRVQLARTPLASTRTFGVEQGRPVLTVTETLVNLAGEPFPISYGQHIVFGAPFLSDACVIDLPGGIVHVHPVEYSANHRLRAGARSPWPNAIGKDGSSVDLRQVPAPGAGYEDQVYLGDLPDGWYAVTNRERQVGLAVRFPHELYRYLWYWQVFSGGAGYPWWSRTYNAGLEPFTSATNQGLQAAVADGSALWLPPGGEVSSTLTVTAFTGQHRVRSVLPDGSIEPATLGE